VKSLYATLRPLQLSRHYAAGMACPPRQPCAGGGFATQYPNMLGIQQGDRPGAERNTDAGSPFKLRL
jgi:hypothetical protein